MNDYDLKLFAEAAWDTWTKGRAVTSIDKYSWMQGWISSYNMTNKSPKSTSSSTKPKKSKQNYKNKDWSK